MNSSSKFNVVSGEKADDVERKNDSMKVVVRVRPPNDRELSQGKVNVIRVNGDYMLTFDPKEEDLNSISHQRNRLSVLEKRIRDLNFAFDRVFSHDATNTDVFEHTTKPVIESVLEGYNCSVFAYGATSAGKTHTMLGSPDSPGVIFLTMMELYKKLMAKEEDYECDISVSYLEIYNETCKDLLLPTGPLAVREDPDKGVCVAGLSLHKPRSAEELLEMLHFGNQNRTQHPTDANKQSSRSHAVFQVFVRQCPKNSGITAKVILSKISLIDLAGSERATVTTNRGDRLREGANINKSLLALGNCINALAENKSNLHIPYRNSKLTRLLKDSLGGNCRTIMIAAVSPSTLSYEDTYNTLKYANRAKKITSSISSNAVNVDYHVSQYAKIVEDLKAEIVRLQEKCNQQLPPPPPPQKTDDGIVSQEKDSTLRNDEKLQDTFYRYSESLKTLYQEKCLFLKKLIDCEAAKKEATLKLLHKERSFNRLTVIQSLSGETVDYAEKRIDNFRNKTATRQQYLEEQASRLKGSLEENQQHIFTLQKEIDEWANTSSQSIRGQVNQLYELISTETEKVKLNAKYKHVKRHLALQDNDQKNNERLIGQLLEIVSAQQQRINMQKPSPANCQKLKELSDTLFSGPRILWADQSHAIDHDMTEMTQEMNFVLDFNSYTPLKTPSRKSTVLRQMGLSSCHGHDNTTTYNTIMNTGAKRCRLPKFDPDFEVYDNVTKSDFKGSKSEDFDGTFILQSNHSDEDQRKKLTDVSLPSQDYLVCETGNSRDKTSHSHTCLDTPPGPSNVLKNFIPKKTPLKSIVSNDRISTENTKRTMPRMRSFTEECDGKNDTVRTVINDVRRPVFHRTFLTNKKRKMNLITPSRSMTNLSTKKSQKENVRPNSSMSFDGGIKRRGLRTAQSCTAVNKPKTLIKERFRF